MKIAISKIKGFIFDLDGTLADTMPLHLEAWNELGAPFGLELSHADHLKYAGMPTLEIARLMAEERNITIDAEAFVAEKEVFFTQKKLPNVKTIPTVAAFLYELQGKIPMAIGTGSTQETAMKVINYLEVQPYVQAIITADKVSKHKPAPDTFLLCAEKIGIAPESCLVFEDASLGMQAAATAGMQAINITECNDEEITQLLNELKKLYI